MAHASIQYGHWGITVSVRQDERDYAPVKTWIYPYPVGIRGPIDCAQTEREAIARCRSLNGVVRGPFFYREDATCSSSS